eukprot:1150257-Prorocentrum_minimum.AAC.1
MEATLRSCRLVKEEPAPSQQVSGTSLGMSDSDPDPVSDDKPQHVSDDKPRRASYDMPRRASCDKPRRASFKNDSLLRHLAR